MQISLVPVENVCERDMQEAVLTAAESNRKRATMHLAGLRANLSLSMPIG
ncbi:MAG: hypothetical protein QOJ51_6153 [Acidobacteriaceae bacterium]|jgi:hypothetical protein|nr:hypothetical protein [Acidobacteriaceae bacterium]